MRYTCLEAIQQGARLKKVPIALHQTETLRKIAWYHIEQLDYEVHKMVQIRAGQIGPMSYQLIYNIRLYEVGSVLKI